MQAQAQTQILFQIPNFGGIQTEEDLQNLECWCIGVAHSLGFIYIGIFTWQKRRHFRLKNQGNLSWRSGFKIENVLFFKMSHPKVHHCTCLGNNICLWRKRQTKMLCQKRQCKPAFMEGSFSKRNTHWRWGDCQQQPDEHPWNPDDSVSIHRETFHWKIK